MVSAIQIRTALEAITGQDTIGTAQIISRSLAFTAILTKNAPDIIEHAIALSQMENNIHEKIRLYMFALDTAKCDTPELFLKTSYTIAKAINEIPAEGATMAYTLLAAAGQKEFEAIVNAAGLAAGVGKVITRKYAKRQTKAKVPKSAPGNVEIYPKSSNIYSYLYSPASKLLHVRFQSNPEKSYAYYDVEQDLYDAFNDADSKGGFFDEHLKKQHSANYKKFS